MARCTPISQASFVALLLVTVLAAAAAAADANIDATYVPDAADIGVDACHVRSDDVPCLKVPFCADGEGVVEQFFLTTVPSPDHTPPRQHTNASVCWNPQVVGFACIICVVLPIHYINRSSVCPHFLFLFSVVSPFVPLPVAFSRIPFLTT